MKITPIELNGMRNFRELGGLKAQDGRTVVSKKFYRCGSLKKATPETMKALYEDYGIRTIIDLRTEDEQAQKPDPAYEGITHLGIGILEEATQGISHEKRQNHQWYYEDPTPMGELYYQMGSMDYCKKQFAKVVKTCLETEGGVAFHCSVGKDRTGIVAFLILTLLGVDKKTIYKDYVYTNKVARKKARKYARKGLFKVGIRKSRVVYDMLIARPEFLDEFERGIIETEGSLLDYLKKSLKIDDRGIKDYRDKYLK
ncbi:MAG: tyrosine-protein phosphatase [Bacilli bacterium]|nr:tyrosine-protein phosphatase [Bacilli bacterium]